MIGNVAEFLSSRAGQPKSDTSAERLAGAPPTAPTNSTQGPQHILAEQTQASRQPEHGSHDCDDDNSTPDLSSEDEVPLHRRPMGTVYHLGLIDSFLCAPPVTLVDVLVAIDARSLDDEGKRRINNQPNEFLRSYLTILGVTYPEQKFIITRMKWEFKPRKNLNAPAYHTENQVNSTIAKRILDLGANLHRIRVPTFRLSGEAGPAGTALFHFEPRVWGTPTPAPYDQKVALRWHNWNRITELDPGQLGFTYARGNIATRSLITGSETCTSHAPADPL